MSSAIPHDELEQWLVMATQGLPNSARQRIREEIEDHYLSEIEHHRAKGQSEREAHRAAMAELGEVRHARKTFRDAHASRGRYLLAGLLSLALPFLFALTAAIEPEDMVGDGPFRAGLIGLAYLAQCLAITLPILYITFTGYGLLFHRFHFDLGKWRIGLFLVGMLIPLLPIYLDAVWLVAAGHAVFTESYVYSYVYGVLTVEDVLGAVGNLALIAFCFSLVLLGYQLRKVEHSLYGARSSLQFFSCMFALVSITQMVLDVFHIEGQTALLVLLFLFSAIAFCIGLGWMFIKAAFMGRLPVLSRDTNRTGDAA